MKKVRSEEVGIRDKIKDEKRKEKEKKGKAVCMKIFCIHTHKV